MLRQNELIERVKSYDADADEAMINRACVFSTKAHGSQKHASGDPCDSHPIEVAGILTDLHLDDETIVTGILHDTIEDMVATQEEIERLFGSNVARLVEGVTKLSKIEAQSESDANADDFQQSLSAITDDIRVLLVKLADRLHNMRTLHFISSPEKRKRIARETMDIYAPLAERIGMYEFMIEMQTLAFKELEPDAFASISRRLEQLHKGEGDLIERIARGLKAHLESNGIEAEVQAREKHPYSIWRKMAEQHVSFEQIADHMMFCVIVSSHSECYLALGLIHRRWPMVPGRVKDFISTPKRNGYQSLHTTVVHDEQVRILIQIRDREMHARAEYGPATSGMTARETRDPERSWIQDLGEILHFNQSVANDAERRTSPAARERAAASLNDLSERAFTVLTTRGAEHVLQRAASPRFIRSGDQIDALRGAYEVSDGVPLEWLPTHLRDCARLLHKAISRNAPEHLAAPLEVYGRAIKDDASSTIIQTLVFCASMIRTAMTDPDFAFWSNGLSLNFDNFLLNHEILIDHYPELERRQSDLAKLAVDISRDVRPPFSEFLSSSRKVLDLLVDAGITTETAKEILHQQLTLAQSISTTSTNPSADHEASGAIFSLGSVHDQAANSLGVWIQVRDHLVTLLSATSHPNAQEALPTIVEAISKFMHRFLDLAPK